MPPTYRYEIASTGRAQCQTTTCKEKGEKIAKGTLRFGSLVKIQEHDTWKWKHWGCVTPQQIANIVDQIGGLGDLDLDRDLDILDGYDELPEDAQEKVKYALVNGHVHDDDWNGDPELNVPGAKGLRKRTPKKKAKKEDEEGEDDDQQASPKPKSKKGRSKNEDDAEPKNPKTSSKKRKAEVVDKEEADEAKPKSKRGAKKTKPVDSDEDVVDEKPKKPAKKSGKKTENASTATNDQADESKDNSVGGKQKREPGRPSKKVKKEDTEADPDDNHTSKAAKSRRTKKVKDEPVEELDVDVADEEPISPQPTKRRGRPRRQPK